VESASESPTFEVTLNEAFRVGGHRRYRQARRGAWFYAALKVFLGVCLAVQIAFCLFIPGMPTVFVASGFITLLAFGRSIDEWLIARAIRNSPNCGVRFRIVLSSNGYAESLARQTAEPVGWAAFTRARRFDDGFVLFRGRAMYHWLPMTALTHGSVEDAETLIRGNIADYRSGVDGRDRV